MKKAWCRMNGVPAAGEELFFNFYFYFYFYILYHVFIVTVQELACSASYGVNKTSISKNSNKRKTIAIRLQVCQILDTSPNIRLTKESKITV